MRRPDVDALLDELTFEEWMEWRAYMGLHPFGAEQDNYRAKAICDAVAASGSLKANNQPVDGRHWFPDSPLGIDWEQHAKNAAIYEQFARDCAESARIRAERECNDAID
jgi:hypothetical protein